MVILVAVVLVLLVLLLLLLLFLQLFATADIRIKFRNFVEETDREREDASTAGICFISIIPDNGGGGGGKFEIWRH